MRALHGRLETFAGVPKKTFSYKRPPAAARRHLLDFAPRSTEVPWPCVRPRRAVAHLLPALLLPLRAAADADHGRAVPARDGTRPDRAQLGERVPRARHRRRGGANAAFVRDRAAAGGADGLVPVGRTRRKTARNCSPRHGCSARRCTSSPRSTCCATCSSREVMTADKLFGAAAAYLMLGVMWAYFYVLVAYLYPDSFSIGGQAGPISYRRGAVLQRHRPDQHGLRRHRAAVAPGARRVHGRGDRRRAVPGDPHRAPGGRLPAAASAGRIAMRQMRPCCARNFDSTWSLTSASLISSMLCLMCSGSGSSSARR